MNKNNKWTIEEIQFLEKYYFCKGPNYIAQKINKSVFAVTSKANRIGLVRKKRRESICWNCAKSGASKCLWDICKKPVEGWIVINYIDGGVSVIDCPEYEEWKR